MLQRFGIEGRWLLGSVALIVIGALVLTDKIPAMEGMAVITAILASLGVYERGQRRKVEGGKNDG